MLSSFSLSYIVCSYYPRKMVNRIRMLNKSKLEFRAVAGLGDVYSTSVSSVARNIPSSSPESKVTYAFVAAHQSPGFRQK